MKAVGVVVEYNPFHNGHAFHLQAAREASGADVVIAVMSGNFLQRGEPALVSKWHRTKMALYGGADIVFELPYKFAVQQAETFANGAVSILDAARCEFLCFGSESGDLSSFLQTVHFLDSNNTIYNEAIKRLMGTGISYPKALSLAFGQLANSEHLLDLSKPNNILGFQYIRAIKDQKSAIKPLTVKRKNANYHDEHFASETIASATSIRKALFAKENKQISIQQFISEKTYALLKEYHLSYGLFHQWENYWNLLQYRLLQAEPDELREIYEVEEGLENRLRAAALSSDSFHGFMEKVKTKRYTWTRLQRVCVHILTNAKKQQMLNKPEKASYLRLLGMTNHGRDYLNKTKFDFGLPLVSRLSSAEEEDLLLDIKASRVYSLAIPYPNRSELLTQEYKQPPIYME